MAQQFSCADRAAVLLFSPAWAALMGPPLYFAAWYLLIPPLFAGFSSLELWLQVSPICWRDKCIGFLVSYATLTHSSGIYCVLSNPLFSRSFSRGLDVKLQRFAAGKVVDGWLVHHRSFSLGPTRNVLCSRLWGIGFLKDFNPKRVIHRSCLAETNVMAKHDQLLVCGPDCFLLLPLSPLLIALHQTYLIFLSRHEYCQPFISCFGSLLKWHLPSEEFELWWPSCKMDRERLSCC